jgi:hypothetical protein
LDLFEEILGHVDGVGLAIFLEGELVGGVEWPAMMTRTGGLAAASVNLGECGAK